ncbi:aspartate aminotransferase family protein [Flammeovirga sp. MY04]|uniref:aspartate aminotransferase family protein n=1 Tax=Flammeovirga sp. MY04 TaxID=1191459 RepID=UPI00080624B2|nr:aminotransferase class III-fold pyridoxal phosphate-dependent enzyme [Flammeovirga sp. MY04]
MNTLMDTKELLSPVWTHLTQINAVRGKGIYIYDEAGEEYMDFTSGIGVTNTGHCHPKVVQAIQDQSQELIFGQMNCVIPSKTVELAEKLNELLPDPLNRFFFSNSGSEATEACVKLAKQYTGRQNVIVMQGSFHGRTHLTMAMTTSKTVYRYKYQPLPSGIFVTPFPNHFQYGWTEDQAIDFAITQLDLVFRGQTAPDETAAIIIEPVLGEGGYVPAPKRYLQHLRKVCDEHGILLIIDEVQSGFGRTGTFFCFEQSDVVPDILVMAKGLGSGMPISGIASTEKIMEKWVPGTHGGTYGGGSVISMAAALATIDTIKEENILENVRQRSHQLIEGLKKLHKQYPMIGDVRGRGLMVATEFINKDGTPSPELAKKVLTECVNNKLLMLACGSYANVIRWIPPLVVNETQIEQALRIFENALAEAI